MWSTRAAVHAILMKQAIVEKTAKRSNLPFGILIRDIAPRLIACSCISLAHQNLNTHYIRLVSRPHFPEKVCIVDRLKPLLRSHITPIPKKLKRKWNTAEAISIDTIKSESLQSTTERGQSQSNCEFMKLSLVALYGTVISSVETGDSDCREAGFARQGMIVRKSNRYTSCEYQLTFDVSS